MRGGHAQPTHPSIHERLNVPEDSLYGVLFDYQTGQKRGYTLKGVAFALDVAKQCLNPCLFRRSQSERLL